MRIVRVYLFLLVFLSVNIGIATEIDIDNTVTTKPLPRFFTGAGIGSTTSILNFKVNEVQNTIEKTFLNPDFLNLCRELMISDYRFPSGTEGNYYHFYGKGSGMDSSEIFCNSTYYGIRNSDKLKQFVNSNQLDQKLEKNYAYYFADFINEIQKSVPNAGFFYHLNSHTHIYKGHLKELTTPLQELINQYFNNNVLLNKSFEALINTIDTNRINDAIIVLEKLKEDNKIITLKQQLLSNIDFQYSFQENMNSIRFFISRKTNLKGIEIGNETEAEYMLFDDNFSYFPYNCNITEDTTDNPFSKLLFRDYLEGILKNWIITTLYADSIHTNFNMPIGLTISGFRANVGFNNNSEPILLKPFGVLEKKAFFWSRFFGNELKIDAYIPHIYSQKILDCNNYAKILDSISSDKINETAIKIIQSFADLVLPYHLNYISQAVSGKPLWITEWNFNMHSFVPNTFLHTYFLHRAIGKNIEFYETNLYNIQSWLLHYLASPYFAFALIKAGYFGRNYVLEKMLPYEAFQIWNNTLNDNVKRLKTNIKSFMNYANEIQCFINEKGNKIYLHYNNISEYDDYFDFKSLEIKNNNSNFDIESIETHILAAKSYLASNYVECTAVKNQIAEDSYEVINYTSDSNIIKIPSKSIGSIVLKIKEHPITKQKQVKKKENEVGIYPNPCVDWLNVEIENYNSAVQYTLNIYSLSGEKVLSFKNIKKNNKFIINYLLPGCYIVSVFQNEKEISTQKIIKQ